MEEERSILHANCALEPRNLLSKCFYPEFYSGHIGEEFGRNELVPSKSEGCLLRQDAATCPMSTYPHATRERPQLRYDPSTI
jgi:hypothetical protein